MFQIHLRGLKNCELHQLERQRPYVLIPQPWYVGITGSDSTPKSLSPLGMLHDVMASLAFQP